ncbi:MAG: manganese efflux pump [Burkholderiales bacterium]|nr:manganese efflux pump [Burkholderiales bacterium]
MHSFFPALGIALANNVDNLGARIAYSLGGIKISLPVNLWVAAITFVISLLAAFLGAELTQALGRSFSSWTAMALLVALGAWMIVQPRLSARRGTDDAREERGTVLGIFLRPETADRDDSKHIDLKEATLLGIALSINNVGGGMSAGMLGLDPFLIGALSAALSFLALWAGNYVAELFARGKGDRRMTTIAGILLIALGLHQVF